MFTPLQLQNIELIQVRDSPLVVTPIMMALQEKNTRDAEAFPQSFYVQATLMPN